MRYAFVRCFLDGMPEFLISFLFLLPALAIAITVHEAAHAAMAAFLGDVTAKNEGRVSLNPLVHLDAMGTLMLFFAGFGWGKPVPYNPAFLKNPIRDEVKIALAGPAANLVLALFLAIPYKVLIVQTALTSVFSSVLIDFLQTTIALNIVLFVFNLLPIPPLDGAKFLHAALAGRHNALYAQIALFGPMVLFTIIAFEWAFGFPILSAVLAPMVDAVWGFVMLRS